MKTTTKKITTKNIDTTIKIVHSNCLTFLSSNEIEVNLSRPRAFL